MSEYEDRERNFDATLGDIMGSWMLDLAKADISRQAGWADLITDFFTPDKNGDIPTVDLQSDLDFDGSDKTKSTVDIKFPVGLALMGEQFAADTANLKMSMNVDSSTLDDSTSKGQASGSGEVKYGIGPFSVGVKISASMSVSSLHKRSSDYRATTDAELTMKRVSAPEPILRCLDAYMRVVDTQCQIAVAEVNQAANAAAQAKGLTPGPTPPAKEN